MIWFYQQDIGRSLFDGTSRNTTAFLRVRNLADTQISLFPCSYDAVLGSQPERDVLKMAELKIKPCSLMAFWNRCTKLVLGFSRKSEPVGDIHRTCICVCVKKKELAPAITEAEKSPYLPSAF